MEADQAATHLDSGIHPGVGGHASIPSWQTERRISFANGFWWYHDPGRKNAIRLDSLFVECEWNVSLLCRRLGIGRRTFARMTEESIGITVKAWLRQIRIVKASHLLREGHKIKHLSQRLGFRHKADFSHEFRKLVGLSPSAYVKSEQSRVFRPDSNS